MNIAAYLSRLGIEDQMDVTVECLRKIHREHLLHIPFENLDIQKKQALTMDPFKLYDKIVGRKRGGSCYELNCLLGHMLHEIGFDVTVLGGKVNGTFFDHNVLKVACEGEYWLVNEEIVESWRQHKVYDPTLWIWAVDVATDQRIVLGIAEYDPDLRECALEWIQVLPFVQGQGIGKLITLSLLNRVKEKEAFAPVAGEVENHTGPERLYRRCGFIGDQIWTCSGRVAQIVYISRI